MAGPKTAWTLNYYVPLETSTGTALVSKRLKYLCRNYEPVHHVKELSAQVRRQALESFVLCDIPTPLQGGIRE